MMLRHGLDVRVGGRRPPCCVVCGVGGGLLQGCTVQAWRPFFKTCVFVTVLPGHEGMCGP